jgi:GntR family transcriptional regulator, vanillate catabolism transcriptional regulator
MGAKARAQPNRAGEQSGRTLNLDDQAYGRIRAMIVEGAMLPGARIVPEQLAQDLGTSRTPILSALKRLYQEGLVEWLLRRGIYIRRPSLTELAQIFELREVLEGLVARRAALALLPVEIERFAALFVGLDTEETPHNRRLYLQRDYQFHAGLLKAADSPPLTSAVEAMNIMVSAFAGGVIRTIHEGMEEHAEIFANLRRRDPTGAEAAMRLHIRRSVDRLYQEAETGARSRPAAAPIGIALRGRRKA